MPRRYILTGAPGAGKTTLIRLLESRGEEVVHEAATDVIALAQASGIDRPWERPDFITDIAALQAFREATPMRSARRFSDRSVFCTLALAEWLDRPIPQDVRDGAEKLAASGWFERRVYLVAQLDGIQHTEARRISYEDATRFGALHAATYRRFGFEPVLIGPGSIADRAERILESS